MEAEDANLEDGDAVSVAYAAIDEKCRRGEELTQLEQDVVLLVAVAGLVGNGGLPYFYEYSLDFPGCGNAFRRVGLAKAGELMDLAWSLFPVGAEVQLDLRLECLARKSVIFAALGREICDQLGLSFRSPLKGVLDQHIALAMHVQNQG